MHCEKYGLLLLILTHVTMWVESSSCVFRLEHGAMHRPTPLQIRRGASITSCGLSCIRLSECHFFAFLNDVCLLTEQIDEKEEGRWMVYKKVIFFHKTIIYVGKLCPLPPSDNSDWKVFGRENFSFGCPPFLASELAAVVPCRENAHSAHCFFQMMVTVHLLLFSSSI